eukprot:scaffold130455_cov69-Phaeocystis_antarctica.AAC.6
MPQVRCWGRVKSRLAVKSTIDSLSWGSSLSATMLSASKPMHSETKTVLGGERNLSSPSADSFIITQSQRRASPVGTAVGTSTGAKDFPFRFSRNLRTAEGCISRTSSVWRSIWQLAPCTRVECSSGGVAVGSAWCLACSLPCFTFLGTASVTASSTSSADHRSSIAQQRAAVNCLIWKITGSEAGRPEFTSP